MHRASHSGSSRKNVVSSARSALVSSVMAHEAELVGSVRRVQCVGSILTAVDDGSVAGLSLVICLFTDCYRFRLPIMWFHFMNDFPCARAG